MNLPKQYSDIKSLKKVMFLYDSALKEIETKIEVLNNEFKIANKYNPIEHVTTRIKTPQSIAKKLRHNNKEFTIDNIIKYINDIAGIRIICSFRSDIFHIAEAISKQSDVKVLKIKDYVTKPKANGYASYHMIVSLPIYLTNAKIDTKVEIQIRTISMDYWASLEHKIYYKFEGNAPNHIRKELKECADIVSFLDEKMLAINDQVREYNITLNDEEDEAFPIEANMVELFGHIYEDKYEKQDESKVAYGDYLLKSYDIIDADSKVKNHKETNYQGEKGFRKAKGNSKESIFSDKKDRSLLSFLKMNNS